MMFYARIENGIIRLYVTRFDTGETKRFSIPESEWETVRRVTKETMHVDLPKLIDGEFDKSQILQRTNETNPELN